MNNRYNTIIFNLLRGLIVLVIVFFVLRIIYQNWESLSVYEWELDIKFFLISIFVLLISFYLMAFGWYLILNMLEEKINTLECLRIYVLSQLGRYIPGKIFMFIGRVVMAQNVGISGNSAVVSIFLEAIISLSGAIAATLIIFYFSNVSIIYINTYYLIIFLILIIVFLHPIFIKYVLVLIKKYKISKKLGSLEFNFKYHQVLGLVSYYIILWAIVGFAFYLLALSISVNISFEFILEIAGAFLLSWIIGFLSFLSPGGIGVREGVLTFILGNYFPVAFASILALGSRVWFTGVELLSVMIISTVYLVLNGRKKSISEV